MRSQILAGSAALLTVCCVYADNLEKSVFGCDRSQLSGKDPAITEKDRKSGMVRRSGWTEYDFEIRKPGWHEFVIYGGGNQPSIWLDGAYVADNVAYEELDKSGGGRKMKNLYLTAGKHVLKIQSTRFPASQPTRWTLTEAKDASGMIRADFAGKNIARLAEPIPVKITAGAPDRKLKFEIVGEKAYTGEIVPLAVLEFGPGLATRTVLFKFPSEGVWLPRLRDGKKLSRPADLGLCRAAVVDTGSAPAPGVRQELIHDIDCVKLTDGGRSLKLNGGFWEAGGKTRVISTPAGTSRESGDNLDPDIRKNRAGEKSKSGFSFDISVPEAQQPYLLELEYPDDDRRTVNLIILNEGNPRDYGQAQLGSGYETGDYYPLSNRMLKHRVVFWPNSKKVTAAVMSMNPGMRAAAARIRVWKLSGVPGGFAARPDGRLMAVWNEEPRRWVAAMQSHQANRAGGGEMGRDFVALNRMAAMCRYAGYNAICPTEAVYQTPTWNSKELLGWFSNNHDAPRLVALFCEKYRLRYIPELHISAQQYFSRNFPKTVKNPDDLYIHSRLGNRAAPDKPQGWTDPCWNALHPDVQAKYIAIIQELVDSIGDSPAFAGVASRMMTWVGTSWAYLPSLNWGYGDWTVGEFSRETGVSVPGRAGDPDRFDQRFRFLTAKSMLPRWRAWRTEKLMAFLSRIRDAIREKNPAAVLYLPYFGSNLQGMDGPFGTLFADNAREAVAETGIDPDALKKLDGICLIAGTGGTGRRYSTILNDFRLHSAVNDSDRARLGRGAMCGSAYFEDHEKIPIDLLGFPNLKPGGYCGGAEPGGRLRLENYSVPLAEGDQQIFRFGGLAYVYGQPEVMHEWLRVYTNLPQEPFEKFAKAVDPVAVWFRPGESRLFGKSKDLCFYAVNRLPSPVRLTLKLDNASVLRAVADGATTALEHGTVTLDFAPYELKGYYADPAARLTDAAATVPDATRRVFRSMLESTAKVRQIVGNVCDDRDRAFLVSQLDRAWEAFQRGAYWSARAALLNYRMIELYEKAGCWPAELMHRSGGFGKLTYLPKMRNVTPEIPAIQGDALAALSRGKITSVASETLNPDWRYEKLITAPDGKLRFELTVPAPGRYRLLVGAAAPKASAAIVAANGVSQVMELAKGGRAERIILPPLTVRNGKITVDILSPDPAFGVYALRLDPVRTALPSPYWLTAGPFRHVDCNYDKKGLTENFTRTWGPETNPDPGAVYTAPDGRKIPWLYSDKIEGRGIEFIQIEAGTSFLLRNKVQGMGLCYALTFVDSPEERDAVIDIACDWWADIFLNGEKVRQPGHAPDCGAEFGTWYSSPAKVRLRKGRNTLLVKVNGGTMSTGFCLWISDPGDLKISPFPDRTAKK